MGQRFQIIVEQQGHIEIYHSQWLWGQYAIRRIGTALRNYINREYKNSRTFYDYLKGSFYGKPADMNSIGRYFNDKSYDYSDNNNLCQKKKRVNFISAIKKLDNNDGYFYVSLDKEENDVIGYCFMRYQDGFKPISARDYVKHYEVIDFNKTQQKEYERGLKTFDNLNVIEPIKTIKKR